MIPIAIRLNEEGYRTRTGASWNYCSVHRILTHPGYKGQHQSGVKMPVIIDESIWQKAQRKRGFSEEQIENRIEKIEEWQRGYTAKSERNLFGRDYGQYIDILNKMDSLCNEARQLVDKVKSQNKKSTKHKVKTTADRIRLYAIENHINPARKRNEKTVSIKSGDIHSEMKLHGNHANVCQALRGEISKV